MSFSNTTIPCMTELTVLSGLGVYSLWNGMLYRVLKKIRKTITLVGMNSRDFLQSYLLKLFISLEVGVIYLNSP